MVDWLLSAGKSGGLVAFSWKVLGSNPSHGTLYMFSILICKMKLVPNLSYNSNLVKMRVVLGVVRYAEFLGYICSLRRHWSFFV